MTAKPVELPDHVDIGPHRYVVSTDRAAVLEASFKMDGQVFGHTDHAGLAITVDGTLRPTMAADTLLHEVLHAVFDMTGLGDQLGEKVEEDAIRRLAPVLLDVLRRNPRFVRYLTA